MKTSKQSQAALTLADVEHILRNAERHGDSSGPELHCNIAISHVLALQMADAIALAGEALELLMSNQNGCPLPKYEKDWNRAMQLGEAALDGHVQ